MQKTGCWKATRACAVFLFCAAMGVPSHAQTLTTLASFNGTNGQYPGGILQGADGNFYGVAGSGGPDLFFKVTPSGTLTDVLTFPSSIPDGYFTGTVMQASDGNFYGTSNFHEVGNGTIFKITPAGVLTTLYTFDGIHGSYPSGRLIQGSDGNLYGTTQNGGANPPIPGFNAGPGTIFKITPGGTLTTLYSFSGPDGSEPVGDLIQGADGNFYGTTEIGGSGGCTTVTGTQYGCGTVFKMTPAGALTTLHNFVFNAGQFAQTEGQHPQTGLVQANDGNFYGTTDSGGQYTYGTIFRISPSGNLTTLHSINGGTEGSSPNAPLIQGADGNLYGIMSKGGNSPLGTGVADGTVFKISTAGTLTTLYSFCSVVQGNDFECADGANPDALIQGADGNLYGATDNGGAADQGTIFRLQLPTTPAPYSCSTQPTITFIDSAVAYGGYSYFGSGSWLEIKGTNLVNPADPRLTAAVNPGQWTAADFNGVNAPTVLDNVSVTINGKPAYVWYLSTGQLNVQAPEDTATGNVAITVNNCTTASAPFMFARRSLAPGFLAPSNYSANGTQYLVAFFASDGAYVLNTSVGASFGVNSRPAKPGDQVYTYGIGFGDVTPSILPGVIAGGSNTLVNPVTIKFGTMAATVAYQGLTPGSVGLYQFNFTVPSGLANGDYQINVMQNGVAVPQTMYLTVQN
jgi:uncharacterized protein (TIGR03437 family)